MDKDKMGEFIKVLANSFEDKSEEEANKRTKDALKLLNESGFIIKSPEDFNYLVNHKIEKCMGSIIRMLYDSENVKNKRKVNFIFINYDFLEGNLKEICILREGSCCCADKSRYILNMYLSYAVTGEIPNFNSKDEHYWIPKFGDNQMWIEFCEGLYRLYYGYTEAYFKAYQKLVTCEIRKYKHILHRWHIKYKNGEDFEVTQSWDNKIDNVLIYDTEDNYYILKKKYVGNNKFEDYKPKNDEQAYFYKNCVCVPKKEVEIYSVDEEKMC